MAKTTRAICAGCKAENIRRMSKAYYDRHKVEICKRRRAYEIAHHEQVKARKRKSRNNAKRRAFIVILNGKLNTERKR